MNKDLSKPFLSEGPQPLLRELPKGAPYPLGALGELKAATEAVQDITQAPAAIAAQSALSLASLAVQAFADVETLNGYAPLSLYCLTIAKSGERKSAADTVFMNGLRTFEREQSAAFREKILGWRQSVAIWKSDYDQIMGGFKKKGADRVALKDSLEALGPEPIAPLTPNLTATEPTLEGLQKLFAAGQPSLGVFSDEGGQFIGGHAMTNDNRLKTIAGLSALWGGEPINRTRAGDGTSTLYGRRLAVHLMVQPVAARPLLADPVANGQGFLARFLISEPPSAIGTRMQRGHSESSNVAVAAMEDRLRTILNTPKPTAKDNLQELLPRQLPLSCEARELLWKYYEEIEAAQSIGGDLEGLSAFASKSPEQAARIAGVLTLWENLDAQNVSGQTMTDAIILSRYYLGEAKRLSEAAEISVEIGQAEKLRLWLLNDWPIRAAAELRSEDMIVPRDIVQFGPGSMRITKVARKLLAVLESHECVVKLPENSEIDGIVRRTAYRIVRA